MLKGLALYMYILISCWFSCLYKGLFISTPNLKHCLSFPITLPLVLIFLPKLKENILKYSHCNMTKSIFVVCFAFSWRYSPQIGSPHQNTMQTLPTSREFYCGSLQECGWAEGTQTQASSQQGDSSQRLETWSYHPACRQLSRLPCPPPLAASAASLLLLG